ncbi:MAG: hypothetical protein LUD48_02050 [Prevotella sp.]|nr:hypothetical protein [Prevotella sp.]
MAIRLKTDDITGDILVYDEGEDGGPDEILGRLVPAVSESEDSGFDVAGSLSGEYDCEPVSGAVTSSGQAAAEGADTADKIIELQNRLIKNLKSRVDFLDKAYNTALSTVGAADKLIKALQDQISYYENKIADLNKDIEAYKTRETLYISLKNSCEDIISLLVNMLSLYTDVSDLRELVDKIMDTRI